MVLLKGNFWAFQCLHFKVGELTASERPYGAFYGGLLIRPQQQVDEVEKLENRADT
jgi:hypothetical protein